jgi:hypothetical protein
MHQRCQLERECLIIAYIYLERALSAKSKSFCLTTGNWRAFMLASFVAASKLHDDFSMINSDFVLVYGINDLKWINQLERVFYKMLDYSLFVSDVEYEQMETSFRPSQKQINQAQNLIVNPSVTPDQEQTQPRRSYSPSTSKEEIIAISPMRCSVIVPCWSSLQKSGGVLNRLYASLSPNSSTSEQI